MNMQMGHNTDIDHLGLIVHVQTEDHGLKDSKITTQVFHNGECLDSRTISYAKAVEGMDENQRDQEVSHRMRTIHKYYINQIHAGTYNDKLPIEQSEQSTGHITNVTQPPPNVIETQLSEQLEERRQPVIIEGEIPTIEQITDLDLRCWRGFEDDYNGLLGASLLAAVGG